MASASSSTAVFNTISLVDSMQLLNDALDLLNKADIIAVDGEGYDLGRDGTLDILSVATKDRNVYLFDIATMGKQVFDAGLKKLLENKSVKKLMFDCRNDADALKHLFGVMLDGVLDVQLMEVKHRQRETPSSTPPPRTSPQYWNYWTRNTPRLFGLKKCISTYLDSKDLVLSKERVVSKMDEDRKNNIWAVRPLEDTLKEYCAIDTCTLFSLHDILKEGQVAMRLIECASARYVDYRRSYNTLPRDTYISHHYLPRNILEIEQGNFRDCVGCKKPFPISEFSKNQLNKHTQVCIVCRAIDENMQTELNRVMNRLCRSNSYDFYEACDYYDGYHSDDEYNFDCGSD